MRVIALLVVLLVWLPGLAAADKSAEQSPGLKVLTQGAGTWKIVVVYNPGMSSTESDHFTETRTVEWILDRQFLLETIHSDKHKTRTLYGYDKNKEKVYRKWSFDNKGATSDWSGTWDAEKKSMTWKPTDGTLDAVVTDRFVSDDQRKVTIVMKDRHGTLLMHVESEHRRVKK